MPDSKCLPTMFNHYKKMDKKESSRKFLPSLNRFAYRYRLAVDFQGLIAPNVGRTLQGYSVITKVFLAYTAYESIASTARQLRVNGIEEPRIHVIINSSLANRLRKDEKLRLSIFKYDHSSDLNYKLKAFFENKIDDVLCVAYALRNVFAHGELTASVIGTNTKATRKVYYDLADLLLEYSDKLFDRCLYRL